MTALENCRDEQQDRQRRDDEEDLRGDQRAERAEMRIGEGPAPRRGVDDSEAEFWTVYGHLKEGGCEAITDCATLGLLHEVSHELSLISGLEVR